MPTKLPQGTAERVVRALARAGWSPARKSASGHRHLRHSERPGIITVPMHSGAVPPGTLRNIIETAGLTVDEFKELL